VKVRSGVSAGAPGSSPGLRGRPRGLSGMSKASLEGASARAGTGAWSDPQSGSRAARVTVKAMPASPGSGLVRRDSRSGTGRSGSRSRRRKHRICREPWRRFGDHGDGRSRSGRILQPIQRVRGGVPSAGWAFEPWRLVVRPALHDVDDRSHKWTAAPGREPPRGRWSIAAAVPAFEAPRYPPEAVRAKRPSARPPAAMRPCVPLRARSRRRRLTRSSCRRTGR
jgi:hypothetical protein